MNNASSSTPNSPAAPLAPSAETAGPRFHVLAELGRGGMATVFLAVVQGPGGFNKLQVIKRLRPALAADPEFLEMFLEEARLAARINHPNIVQTNEVGYDGKYHYIAMEYLDGQSLEAIVRRMSARKKGPLPFDLHLRVLVEALGGLHAAHELKTFDGTPLNVVHRDMSPHNVMVTYDGQIKVLDFGIAKAADSSSQTRTGIMKGKCAYMAVEQFGGKGVDRRVDVFAVGVMLWQAITGTRLWKGISDAEIFQNLAAGEIRRPSTVAPCDPEIEEICMKALSIQRDDRFATAAEFQAAIEGYLAKLAQHRGTRDVGQFVSELFADTRANLAAVIETQMKVVLASSNASTRSGKIPIVRSDVGKATGSFTADTEQVSAPASGEPVADVPTRSRARLFALAVAGVGALAVATVSLVKLKNRDAGRQHGDAPNEMATATADPTNASTATQRAAPLPALVHLTAHASPSTATLFLDDLPLQGNPATATLPRDGASHRIRAQANGFSPKAELVTFNSPNVTVDIALDHAAPVVRWVPHGKHGGGSQDTSSAASAASAATPPAPPTPTAKAGGDDPWAATGRRAPPPDTNDPWKNGGGGGDKPAN